MQTINICDTKLEGLSKNFSVYNVDELNIDGIQWSSMIQYVYGSILCDNSSKRLFAKFAKPLQNTVKITTKEESDGTITKAVSQFKQKLIKPSELYNKFDNIYNLDMEKIYEKYVRKFYINMYNSDKEKLQILTKIKGKIIFQNKDNLLGSGPDGKGKNIIGKVLTEIRDKNIRKMEIQKFGVNEKDEEQAIINIHRVVEFLKDKLLNSPYDIDSYEKLNFQNLLDLVEKEKFEGSEKNLIILMYNEYKFITSGPQNIQDIKYIMNNPGTNIANYVNGKYKASLRDKLLDNRKYIILKCFMKQKYKSQNPSISNQDVSIFIEEKLSKMKKSDIKKLATRVSNLYSAGKLKGILEQDSDKLCDDLKTLENDLQRIDQNIPARSEIDPSINDNDAMKKEYTVDIEQPEELSDKDIKKLDAYSKYIDSQVDTEYSELGDINIGTSVLVNLTQDMKEKYDIDSKVQKSNATILSIEDDEKINELSQQLYNIQEQYNQILSDKLWTPDISMDELSKLSEEDRKQLKVTYMEEIQNTIDNLVQDLEKLKSETTITVKLQDSYIPAVRKTEELQTSKIIEVKISDLMPSMTTQIVDIFGKSKPPKLSKKSQVKVEPEIDESLPSLNMYLKKLDSPIIIGNKNFISLMHYIIYNICNILLKDDQLAYDLLTHDYTLGDNNIILGNIKDETLKEDIDELIRLRNDVYYLTMKNAATKILNIKYSDNFQFNQNSLLRTSKLDIKCIEKLSLEDGNILSNINLRDDNIISKTNYFIIEYLGVLRDRIAISLSLKYRDEYMKYIEDICNNLESKCKKLDQKTLLEFLTINLNVLSKSEISKIMDRKEESLFDNISDIIYKINHKMLQTNPEYLKQLYISPIIGDRPNNWKINVKMSQFKGSDKSLQDVVNNTVVSQVKKFSKTFNKKQVGTLRRPLDKMTKSRETIQVLSVRQKKQIKKFALQQQTLKGKYIHYLKAIIFSIINIISVFFDNKIDVDYLKIFYAIILKSDVKDIYEKGDLISREMLKEMSITIFKFRKGSNQNYNSKVASKMLSGIVYNIFMKMVENENTNPSLNNEILFRLYILSFRFSDEVKIEDDDVYTCANMDFGESELVKFCEKGTDLEGDRYANKEECEQGCKSSPSKKRTTSKSSRRRREESSTEKFGCNLIDPDNFEYGCTIDSNGKYDSEGECEEACTKKTGDEIELLENIKITEERVERSGLKIVKVEGDGNCLFRAVSQQLINNDYSKKNYSIEKLRKKTVKYIKENSDKLWDEGKVDQEYIDNYIQNMSKDGTWGTDLEIRVLSRILKINIFVITTNQNSSGNTLVSLISPEQTSGGKSSDKDIILYNIYGIHYDGTNYNRNQKIEIPLEMDPVVPASIYINAITSII